MRSPEGEGRRLEADASNRRPRVLRLGSRVDAVAQREDVQQDEPHEHRGDEQQATQLVTTLSLAPVWYSELGQVELYLD